MFPEFEHIAANVRRYRLKKGWTQADLAEAVELDITSISRMERAEASMLLVNVLKVAKALEVPPAVLLKPAKFTAQKPGRPARK